MLKFDFQEFLQVSWKQKPRLPKLINCGVVITRSRGSQSLYKGRTLIWHLRDTAQNTDISLNYRKICENAVST